MTEAECKSQSPEEAGQGATARYGSQFIAHEIDDGLNPLKKRGRVRLRKWTNRLPSGFPASSLNPLKKRGRVRLKQSGVLVIWREGFCLNPLKKRGRVRQ